MYVCMYVCMYLFTHTQKLRVLRCSYSGCSRSSAYQIIRLSVSILPLSARKWRIQPADVPAQSLDLLWMAARGYNGCMVNLSFRQTFPEMFAGFSINKGLYSRWLRWLVIKILWVLSRIDRLLRLRKLFSIQPVEPWQFLNQDLAVMVVMMMFFWHFQYHKGLAQESGKNKSHYSHLHLVQWNRHDHCLSGGLAWGKKRSCWMPLAFLAIKTVAPRHASDNMKQLQQRPAELPRIMTWCTPQKLQSCSRRRSAPGRQPGGPQKKWRPSEQRPGQMQKLARQRSSRGPTIYSLYWFITDPSDLSPHLVICIPPRLCPAEAPEGG